MKKFLNEFKTFISRGNVMDMAIGVVIATAFGKISASLVADIIMPLIGCLIGGVDLRRSISRSNPPSWTAKLSYRKQLCWALAHF